MKLLAETKIEMEKNLNNMDIETLESIYNGIKRNDYIKFANPESSCYDSIYSILMILIPENYCKEEIPNYYDYDYMDEADKRVYESYVSYCNYCMDECSEWLYDIEEFIYSNIKRRMNF